jgi:hypothetical protein
MGRLECEGKHQGYEPQSVVGNINMVYTSVFCERVVTSSTAVDTHQLCLQHLVRSAVLKMTGSMNQVNATRFAPGFDV